MLCYYPRGYNGLHSKEPVRFDKSSEQHYDNISAFIKSMRGSDPDAAVFYLAVLYMPEKIGVSGKAYNNLCV